MRKNRIFAIVPAAGSGLRMASGLPKQYLTIKQDTVLSLTLARIFDSLQVEKVVVAASSGDPYLQKSIVSFGARCVRVEGGEERCYSVLRGLEYLEKEVAEDDWVLVHDAARPCVRSSDIQNLMATIEHSSVGGILGAPATDTLKVFEEGKIVETLDRSKVWRALTPQIFRFKLLIDAMRFSLKKGLRITDEAQAVESFGSRVSIVLGHSDNIKITFPGDLKLAEYFLSTQESL